MGGTPVRIVDFETDCGCAVPSIEPRTIPPGGVAIVEVEATPLATGEKTVSVILKTDAAESPEVELRLRIVGGRKPPYLAQVGGDLGYISDFSRPEIRQFFVFTLELSDTAPSPPSATSDLPDLRISQASLLEEAPSVVAGVVTRKYQYEATYSGRPLEPNFVGEVLVIDPWDPDHSERLRVHGEVIPPLRVVPARVVLWTGERIRDKIDGVVSNVGRRFCGGFGGRSRNGVDPGPYELIRGG